MSRPKGVFLLAGHKLFIDYTPDTGKYHESLAAYQQRTSDVFQYPVYNQSNNAALAHKARST